MTFQRFKALCKTICAVSGQRTVLQFSEVEDKFHATFADISITARPGSEIATVSWGSGHCAQVDLGKAAANHV